MKHPLLPVAMWYAAGIVMANVAELSLGPLLFFALLLGVGSLQWARMRPFLLPAFVLLAGSYNLSWRTAVLSPHDLRVLLGEQSAQVIIQGRLCGAPADRVFEREGEELWRTVVPLDAARIRIGNGDWEPVSGRVQTSTPGALSAKLFAGQTVVVSGVLAPPPGPVAEGLFDYASYLGQRGVFYQLKVNSAADWRMVGEPQPRPWSHAFRRWALGTLERGITPADDALRLRWAMILGWKVALTDEVAEPFMRSGTMHIFAISGLHVALIAGILAALLRTLNLPRSVCGAVIIPLLWFYAAVTDWQASAVRSTVMMSVIIAGWSLRRPSDLLNSLAAAAFLLLLWEPRQLFQASFQLSFCVVLSIALLVPRLEHWRQRLLQTDPFLPAKLRPAWQRALLWAGDHVTKGLFTSLAAWLGSLPLIACYFHLFTPVSLLANLVVVPLSGLTLMCGMGSLLCGAWLPWATELFNHSGWFFMRAMVAASTEAANLPGAYRYVAAPGLPATGLYYLLLLAVLSGWFFNRFRWRAFGSVGLAAVAWGGFGWVEWTATRVAILPLRGGHAVWLDAVGRADDMLIDCGDPPCEEFVTTPFLRSQGVRAMSRLVLSHGDVRHVGGATNLMQKFKIQELCVSPARSLSQPYRRSVMAWTNQHGPIRIIQSGDQLGVWRVLHPAAHDHFPTADENALVLRGEWHGVRLLLLSDLGLAGQDRLLQRTADLRADIVVAGLPKNGEPLHDALLDAIQPRLMVIADADYPAPERASLKLKARLARRGVPVIYMRESQAVTLKLRHGRWSVRSMDGRRFAGAAVTGTTASASAGPEGDRHPDPSQTAAAADSTAGAVPNPWPGSPNGRR